MRTLDERIAALEKHRYISVTTYRRDGREVATPVWFVPDGDRILVWTDAASGKAKRIRANGRVAIAPCDARGKPSGAALVGTARILPAEQDASSRGLLTKRYRLMKPVVDAWTTVTHAVRRKKRPTEIFVEIRLMPGDGEPRGAQL
jgi:PPOX class probable F420-dependent enzyme